MSSVVDAAKAWDCVNRICADQNKAESRLLKHLVTVVLRGATKGNVALLPAKHELLLQRSLAKELYHGSKVAPDNRKNTLRTDVSRLRSMLETYYLVPRTDPYRLELPKGGYRVEFVPAVQFERATEQVAEEELTRISMPGRRLTAVTLAIFGVLVALIGGGVLWSAINALFRLPFYWTESGNEPASMTAFVWGSVTLGLVPVGAVLVCRAGHRFGGLPPREHVLGSWRLMASSYALMGGMGATIFQACRIRPAIESLGWSYRFYTSQEVVLGTMWSGLLSAATLPALFVLPEFRQGVIRLKWVLMLVAFAVLPTGVAALFLGLSLQHSFALDRGRGLLGGMSLRFGLFLGLLVVLHRTASMKSVTDARSKYGLPRWALFTTFGTAGTVTLTYFLGLILAGAFLRTQSSTGFFVLEELMGSTVNQRLPAMLRAPPRPAPAKSMAALTAAIWPHVLGDTGAFHDYRDVFAGWRFRTNADLSVTALAVYDAKGDGFRSGSHWAGVWDDTGSLLAGTQVFSTDPWLGADNSFRYHSIPALSLRSSRTYIVAAEMGEDLTGAGGMCQTDSRITWLSARLTADSKPGFPSENRLPIGYFGANLMIAEPPASLAIDFAASPLPQEPPMPKPYYNRNVPPELSNHYRTLGWQFDVSGGGATVTALGFYDDRKNGIGASHEVAIWSPVGELVAWGVVETFHPLNGWWRMAPISPVTLPPGVGYRIAALNAGEYYTWNPRGFTVGQNIRFTSDLYVTPPTWTLGLPIRSSGVTGWFGPNFEYKPVPGMQSCSVQE